MVESRHIQDHDQNFWHLACIQSAALGLPGIFIGSMVAKQDGIGSAIISICLGNMILWIIGLTLVTMASSKRRNAIQNVRRYLGKPSGIFAGFILMLAFLSWYILQIQATTDVLSPLLKLQNRWETNIEIRVGTALGFIVALISIGGIRVIRKFCTFVFPFLALFPIYLLLTVKNLPSFSDIIWSFSLTGVLSIIAQNLVGIINLPTFFRHSRSRADSYLALSLMTIFVALFQIFSVCIGLSDSAQFITNYVAGCGQAICTILAVLFVLVAFVCVNLVNIYFASAGWEIVIIHLWSPKEYAIVGLFGTAAYVFLQISSPMIFLENLANNFMANLGVVLLIDFLIRIVVRHRPRTLEKIVSSICWTVGCIVSLILQLRGNSNPNFILLVGASATVLAFLILIFIEETIWSLRKVKISKSQSNRSIH